MNQMKNSSCLVINKWVLVYWADQSSILSLFSGKSPETLMIETTTENSSDTFPTTKNPVDQPCDPGTKCWICFYKCIYDCDIFGSHDNVICYGCDGPDSMPKESTCPKKNLPWLLVIAGQALFVICLVAFVKFTRFARRIRIRNDPERQPLIS